MECEWLTLKLKIKSDFYSRLRIKVVPPRVFHNYVTGYEKRDHLGFFMKTEFLVWIESSVCAEYNGASSMKKILITSGVMTIFKHLGTQIRFLENRYF